ncbi:MAG: hypothetical protein K5857_11045 [Lachnospiraceae bacterium]|nr:hypothetical protein [Lachnospiraceae bacterium]
MINNHGFGTGKIKMYLRAAVVISILAALLCFNTSRAMAAEKEEEPVSTKHTITLHGEEIEYTATAGTMTINNGDEECEIFYITYIKDGVEDVSERPITFAFNGGPGASSSYINFLCMGPKRLELDEKGHATSLPGKLIDNENSMLDMTDLVFIDAIGTGYSRAEENEAFTGYDNDISSVGEFIRLYTNRNKRWASPKYLAGESYGTIRAVGLCEYLLDQYNMGVNGLMLISSVNDYSIVFNTPGNDLPYALLLPTYAADARYQGLLDDEYEDMELEEFLDQVREFVSSEYVPALFMGRSLSKEKQEEIAGKMSDYIGLSEDYILEMDLRVDLYSYIHELLRDKRLMTGRYDGRFTGPVTDSWDDPSIFDLDTPLYDAMNHYITDELEYTTDTPYVPLNLDINSMWDFNRDNSFLSQQDTIQRCMTLNSKMKIWVLCGYYDGATPFYGAEWIFDHVFMDDSLRDNLTFTYYPSGHMIYIDEESFDKFRKDAEDWYLDKDAEKEVDPEDEDVRSEAGDEKPQAYKDLEDSLKRIPYVGDKDLKPDNGPGIRTGYKFGKAPLSRKIDLLKMAQS